MGVHLAGKDVVYRAVHLHLTLSDKLLDDGGVLDHLGVRVRGRVRVRVGVRVGVGVGVRAGVGLEG